MDVNHMNILVHRVDDEDNEPCTPSSDSESDETTRTTNSYFASQQKTPINGKNGKNGNQNKIKNQLQWIKKSKQNKQNPQKKAPSSSWRRSTPTKAPTIIELDHYSPPKSYFYRFQKDLVYGIIFSRAFRSEIIRLINIQNAPISVERIYNSLQDKLQDDRYESYHNRPELVKYSIYQLFISWVKKRVLIKCNTTKRFKIGSKFLKEYHKSMTFLEQHNTKTTPECDMDVDQKIEIDVMHANDTRLIDDDDDQKEMSDDEKCIEECMFIFDTNATQSDEYKQKETKLTVNIYDNEQLDAIIYECIETESKKDGYPHETYLKNITTHYENHYKSIQNMKHAMDDNVLLDVEMKCGRIIPRISSTMKSIFSAFEAFKTMLQNTIKSSIERQYAFCYLTKSIINKQIRVVSMPQSSKFAMAQFLKLLIRRYKSEYVEIYKSVFHKRSFFTIPFISNSIQNKTIPSIERCKILKYIAHNDPDNISFEEIDDWQIFSDDDVFEDEYSYVERHKSICCIYASVLYYIDDTVQCWRWIAALVSLPPAVYPELLYILCDVLEIIGNMMLVKYPTQFTKIIVFVHDNIFAKCDDSTGARAKAKRKWQLFWKQITVQYEGNEPKFMFKIDKPEESVLISESVGADALFTATQIR